MISDNIVEKDLLHGCDIKTIESRKNTFMLKSKLTLVHIDFSSYNPYVIITRSGHTGLLGIYDLVSQVYTGELYEDIIQSKYFILGYTPANTANMPRESRLHILGTTKQPFKEVKYIESNMLVDCKVTNVWVPKTQELFLVNTDGRKVMYGKSRYLTPYRMIGEDIYLVSGLRVFNGALKELCTIH